MQRPLDTSRVVELAEMRQLLEGVAKIEPDRDWYVFPRVKR